MCLTQSSYLRSSHPAAPKKFSRIFLRLVERLFIKLPRLYGGVGKNQVYRRSWNLLHFFKAITFMQNYFSHTTPPNHNALLPLFTQSSISDSLNFHCRPILCAGMSVFFIQFRTVSLLTPKCSATHSRLLHFSSLGFAIIHPFAFSIIIPRSIGQSKCFLIKYE